VTLIGESQLERDLGDGNAILEHPPRAVNAHLFEVSMGREPQIAAVYTNEVERALST
jgi:hypothetical protein